MVIHQYCLFWEYPLAILGPHAQEEESCTERYTSPEINRVYLLQTAKVSELQNAAFLFQVFNRILQQEIKWSKFSLICQ